MGRLVTLVLAAWGASHYLGAMAQPKCVTQMRSSFANLQCKDAADATCLCAKDNFFFGVRDCGRHCGTNDDNVRQFLKTNFCAGHLPVPAASSSPAASTSPPPTTSASATSSASIAAASSQTSTSTSSTSPAASTTTSVTSSTGSSASTSQTSAAPAATTSGSAAAGEDAASALSQASVIGIGVGVGAAVIAVAGVIICLLLRSRQRAPRQSMEISKPLPGSGRTYAGREQSFEKYGNDIEMTTNRYEDMVPRQQPRTMV